MLSKSPVFALRSHPTTNTYASNQHERPMHSKIKTNKSGDSKRILGTPYTKLKPFGPKRLCVYMERFHCLRTKNSYCLLGITSND